MTAVVADRAISIGLAALGGLAAWLTLGVQAVVDPAAQTRVGVLPPWWWLLALETTMIAAVVIRRVPPARLWPVSLTVLTCLPWLPGALPPAFLMWTGPVAVLLWAVVAVAVAMPVFRAAGDSKSAWLRDPRRAPWLLAAIVVVLDGAGAWAMRARIPDGDEPHYLVITQSLLGDGDLRIENNHQRRDYLAYIDREIPPDYIERGTDGAIYSIHAPGVSILVAPGFALAGWPGAVITMIALAALTAALVWLLVWTVTEGDATASWLSGVAIALTAPGYFHGFTVFPDGAGALVVAYALLVLARIESGARVSAAGLVSAGTSLAMLPWLHTRFAVLAAGLGLILGLRVWHCDWRARALLSLFVVPIGSAAAWFAFFWAIWGTPNPAAPYGQATQSAWAHLQPAIPGLLFDQQFGLVPAAPVYGVALLGLLPLVRRHRRLAIEVGLVLVTYLVAVGTYRMWWGGFSAPARFLVAALPLFALPLAEWWRQGTGPRRALTLVLLAVGFFMVDIRLAVDGGALVYNTRNGVDLLMDWASRLVSLPLALPSLHRDPVGVALIDIGRWVVASAVLITTALLISRRSGQPLTWSAAGLAATVMVAATLVWSGRDGVVLEGRSTVHLLSAWPAGARAVFWRSAPFGPADAGTILRQLAIAGIPAPEARRRGVLFDAPLVPAGEYALEGAGTWTEPLRISVGGSALLLDAIGPERAAPRLSLPADVRGLMISGPSVQGATAPLVLRPVRAGAPSALRGLVARAAARYGAVRVFAFDDNVYLENAGFWTRGGRTTRLLVDPPNQAQSFTVRAGPVATHVRISDDDWSWEGDLRAGETATVQPPNTPDPRPLRVATSASFRPADYDQASRDLRPLGVWMEVGTDAVASSTDPVAIRSGRRR